VIFFCRWDFVKIIDSIVLQILKSPQKLILKWQETQKCLALVFRHCLLSVQQLVSNIWMKIGVCKQEAKWGTGRPWNVLRTELNRVGGNRNVRIWWRRRKANVLGVGRNEERFDGVEDKKWMWLAAVGMKKDLMISNKRSECGRGYYEAYSEGKYR
jgi:hypothetical protein